MSFLNSLFWGSPMSLGRGRAPEKQDQRLGAMLLYPYQAMLLLVYTILYLCHIVGYVLIWLKTPFAVASAFYLVLFIAASLHSHVVNSVNSSLAPLCTIPLLHATICPDFSVVSSIHSIEELLQDNNLSPSLAVQLEDLRTFGALQRIQEDSLDSPRINNTLTEFVHVSSLVIQDIRRLESGISCIATIIGHVHRARKFKNDIPAIKNCFDDLTTGLEHSVDYLTVLQASLATLSSIRRECTEARQGFRDLGGQTRTWVFKPTYVISASLLEDVAEFVTASSMQLGILERVLQRLKAETGVFETLMDRASTVFRGQEVELMLRHSTQRMLWLKLQR